MRLACLLGKECGGIFLAELFQRFSQDRRRPPGIKDFLWSQKLERLESIVEHRGAKPALTGSKVNSGRFLLASFQNHLSDAGDRARRLKRGGDMEFVRLDAEDAEER